MQNALSSQPNRRAGLACSSLLLLIFAAPGPAPAAAAGGVAVSGTEILICGADTLRFYLFDADHWTVAEYWRGPYVFPDHSTGDRVVHERRSNMLTAICNRHAAAFETSRNLKVGAKPLPGSAELFALYDSRTGNRLGTVWIDMKPPFADQGTVGFQRFYACPDGGYVHNVAAFYTGLDAAAIAADPATRENEYIGLFRSRLERSLEAHMTSEEGCKRITKQDFAWEFPSGHGVHYDVIDPPALLLAMDE
ncbi:MAG: hypothetical protein HYV63_30950 [Candidatus Schekmanbacteria bacterium]|nr:hypothetical protein [Candidatus Schekmanbacteria bacterium]